MSLERLWRYVLVHRDDEAGWVGIRGLYDSGGSVFRVTPSTALKLLCSELLRSFLLITSLYFYKKEKCVIAGVAIALSCLTRETMLLMWVALVLGRLWAGKSWKQITPLVLAGLPSIVWGTYTEAVG
jgi:hypothetical protein